MLAWLCCLPAVYSRHAGFDSACSTALPMAGEVHAFTTSSGETRCFSLYRPTSAPSPAPVVIYFHSHRDTAVECGREGSEFVRQAYLDGFTLLCAEARELSDSGWRLGNYGVVHDENANPCDAHDNLEKPYMDKLLNTLRTKRLGDFFNAGDISQIQSTNPAFAMGRVYAVGYGNGAAFAAYASFCYPASISGFVQSGSGLKRKGDGVLLESGAGECPDCQYWPVKVVNANAIGRSFRHCAFASLGDTIAPTTMSRAMCAAMRSKGHSSTLYMSPSGSASNKRPERFLARAAYCLQIGGANASPLPQTDSCNIADTYHSPGSISGSSPVREVSVDVDPLGSSLASASSRIVPVAFTAEPCPPGNWVPNPSSTISSHGCPCGCNGILPDACAESCSTVTIIRRIAGEPSVGHQADEKRHAHMKQVQSMLSERTTAAFSYRAGATPTAATLKVNTSGLGAHFTACPPGVSPSSENNYCMLSSMHTTYSPASGYFGRETASTFPRLKVTTNGCPAHYVDHNMSSQSELASYQQYSVTIPFISDALGTNDNGESTLGPVPVSDAIPSFGGPVGIAVDGAFFFNDLTSTGHDAVLSESFDSCHGHNDELGRYHYHQIPLCLLELLGGTTPPKSTWSLLSSAKIHANGTNLHEWVSVWPENSPEGPSPLLGWALDGVPIYGPYDETGSLLAWGGDFPNAKYSNITSRLDACNGRIRPSDGRYVYHLTPTPPYTVGCFRGRYGLGAVTGSALKLPCPGKTTSRENNTGLERHTVAGMCTLAREATSTEISRARTKVVESADVQGVVRRIVKVKVTLGPKTLDNPQHPSYFAGQAADSDPLCFYLDGVETSGYVMQRGLTYQFFQSEFDFAEHPFRFYYGSHLYNEVDVTNFASSNFYYSNEDDDLDVSDDGIMRRLVLEYRVDSLSPRVSAAALQTSSNGQPSMLTIGSMNGLRMGGVITLRTINEQVVRVTVAPKTLGNIYHPAIMPNASPLGYYFDGTEADKYELIRGTTYIFDQTTSASNAGHPLRFYLTNDKAVLYDNNEDVSMHVCLSYL